ncbi:hypothetical protein M405DRAFT_478256 [Rhizopogon salebrosus TDB-379]|nr:hypothetical protein M405DRAFT_478256 [Rhizopogon salebrosus TDB-379]
MRVLILTTSAGHYILGRYHRTHDNRDLSQSIEHSERARDPCPLDHPVTSQHFSISLQRNSFVALLM